MFAMLLYPLLGCVTVVLAQQVYLPAEGPSPRPQCRAKNVSVPVPATPVYSFTPFSFTQTETVRTATSVTPGPRTTYAPPYESLSHLVPDLSTTTWGNWYPNATATASDTEDPYGQSAWSALWERASIANFTSRGLYSTTVSPTPVATSELVLPPPEYFGTGPTPDCYDFPSDFRFGVAGSAAQIEGAIADEGRAPTVMEAGPFLPDNDHVTNENYYLYKQDIERLASMGVRHYSFSIPWTRILPFALEGSPVNSQGLQHYDDLVDFVLDKGMVPAVTLLHFDTPLQFYYGNLSAVAGASPWQVGYSNGAYQNETFEDAFVHYGKVILTHFADRVPVFFTFNEPLLYSVNGKSVDTVIKAHARLWHFYHDDIGGSGQVALKLNDNFGVPKDPRNQSHVDAANHFNAFQLGTFANPLFLGEDYPDAYKITVPDYVPLSADDLAYLNGTADIFGVDPYTATVVSPPDTPDGIAGCAANTSDPLWPYCVQQEAVTTNWWNIGYRSESYVYTAPTYLRTYLGYLWNTWRKPVVITEFGYPVSGEANLEALEDALYDSPRSDYYRSYLSEVLKATWEDGVHVAGAFAWSFADNWEFGHFDQRFGLQTVNRTTQERRYKKSFFDLVDFVNSRTPPPLDG